MAINAEACKTVPLSSKLLQFYKCKLQPVAILYKVNAFMPSFSCLMAFDKQEKNTLPIYPPDNHSDSYYGNENVT